ncbi:DciA family protein, partial [Candidatus Omnitrophota bacterium]
VVQQVVGDLSKRTPEQGLQRQIVATWDDTVGRRVAKHTRVAGLKKGELLVLVDSPVFLFHVNLKRAQLLTKLQILTSDIQNIRLRIGKV